MTPWTCEYVLEGGGGQWDWRNINEIYFVTTSTLVHDILVIFLKQIMGFKFYSFYDYQPKPGLHSINMEFIVFYYKFEHKPGFTDLYYIQPGGGGTPILDGGRDLPGIVPFFRSHWVPFDAQLDLTDLPLLPKKSVCLYHI